MLLSLRPRLPSGSQKPTWALGKPSYGGSPLLANYLLIALLLRISHAAANSYPPSRINHIPFRSLRHHRTHHPPPQLTKSGQR